MNLRKLLEDELGLSYDNACIRIDEKFKNIAKHKSVYCYTFYYNDIEYAARFIANVVLNQHKLDKYNLDENVLRSEAKHAASKLHEFKIHTFVNRKGYDVAIYHNKKVYQKLQNLSIVYLWCLYDIVRFCFAYRDGVNK